MTNLVHERMGRHFRATEGAESLTDEELGRFLMHTRPINELVTRWRAADTELRDEGKIGDNGKEGSDHVS